MRWGNRLIFAQVDNAVEIANSFISDVVFPFNSIIGDACFVNKRIPYAIFNSARTKLVDHPLHRDIRNQYR